MNPKISHFALQSSLWLNCGFQLIILFFPQPFVFWFSLAALICHFHLQQASVLVIIKRKAYTWLICTLPALHQTAINASN